MLFFVFFDFLRSITLCAILVTLAKILTVFGVLTNFSSCTPGQCQKLSVPESQSPKHRLLKYQNIEKVIKPKMINVLAIIDDKLYCQACCHKL